MASGDRSERIRTYNFPQGRMSDHRINLTLYRLNEIMEGSLQLVMEPIMQENQADLLAELAEQINSSFVSHINGKYHHSALDSIRAGAISFLFR